jgi:tRNA pseudouridine55 synthase
MDGLLIIDKPEGLTSHDVVGCVRRALHTKRVGHTGTLDPFATGVLVLLIGKATRLAQFLDEDEKEYEAVIQFGFETDTGDKTGKPKTENPSVNVADLLELERVLPEFIGEIEQVPPMYSAKKQAGKKLYELARQGKQVERTPITVLIKELELMDEDKIRDPRSALRIRVVCSAGTYIRTLAEDIGRRLDIGAHLTELRRTRAGKFGLDQSIELDKLDATIKPLAIEEAVSHLPEFVLSTDRVEKTRNGMTTRTNENHFSANEVVRMTDDKGRLIAIGVNEEEIAQIRPKIVLA